MSYTTSKLDSMQVNVIGRKPIIVTAIDHDTYVKSPELWKCDTLMEVIARLGGKRITVEGSDDDKLFVSWGNHFVEMELVK